MRIDLNIDCKRKCKRKRKINRGDHQNTELPGTNLVVTGTHKNTILWLFADNDYKYLPECHVYESILNVIAKRHNVYTLIEYPEEIDLIPSNQHHNLMKNSGLAYLYMELKKKGLDFDVLDTGNKSLLKMTKSLIISRIKN